MAGDRDGIPENLDPSRPSAARIYDYALGGGHNLASDRAVFDRIVQVQPNARQMAWSTRAFMRRSVLFMVDQGIRQFLDLGSGIPTVGNVHEIARRAAPESRVVYVDFEELAVAHTRLLLEGDPLSDIVDADITRPRDVLQAPETVRLLDFDRPVGLLAVSVGHFIGEDTDIEGVFTRYREAVVPGSALSISHFTADFEQVRAEEIIAIAQPSMQDGGCPRGREEVLRLFGDFDLVEPGLVPPSSWRPDTTPPPSARPEDDGFWAGVAVKRARPTA